MIVRVARLLLCSVVITSIVTGCNKPQDATTLLKPNSILKTEIKDEDVTGKVKAALLYDEKLRGFDVAVATLKGDVRLTGLADNQSQIDYVKKIARSIEGVHSIHDELSIKK